MTSLIGLGLKLGMNVFEHVLSDAPVTSIGE